MRKLVLATRGSKLALRQSEIAVARLREVDPFLEVEIKKIRTSGDRFLKGPLKDVGGKGLFVKEIQESLLRREADLAVHSLKDVPAEVPEELTFGAVLEREEPYDVLVSNRFKAIEHLPFGARVGTSSLRRRALLLAMRPDLKIEPLRGNLDTRLRKLTELGLDAIVVGLAGMKRLGIEGEYMCTMKPPDFVPAVGQGIIVIQCRKDDHEVMELLAEVDHRPTRIAMEAERAFLETTKGGCQVPIGAFAEVIETEVVLTGMMATIDGARVVRREGRWSAADPATLGREIGEQVLAAGGRKILKQILGSATGE